MNAAQSSLIEIKDSVRREIRAATVAQSLAFVFAVFQAGILGFALAALVSDGRFEPILFLAWIGLSLLRLGAGYSAEAMGARAASKLKRVLRERISRLFLREGQGLDGSVVAAINDDVDAMGPYISRYEPVRIALAAGMLAALAFVFTQSWVAGAILVLTGPLTPLFMALVGYRAEEESRRKLDALQDMSRYFVGRLRALDIISAYGAEAMEAQRLRRHAETHRSASVGVLRVAFLSSATIDFFATLSIALVATYVGLSLLGIMPFSTGETVTPVEGFAALMIAPEFFAPLRRFAQAYHDRADAAAAAERLTPFWADATTEMVGQECAGAAGRVEAIRLQVGFAGGSVTRPIDAVFLQDQISVLTGESGAGKSALLHTIAGLRAPAAGSLQRAHGAAPVLVVQSPFLFAGTVRENLALGAAYSDEQMINALRQVGLAVQDQVARDLLDRPLGEIALGVSGGEGRRLAIARALLRETPVLLLDEPTAHLDMQSERTLIETLKRVSRGRIIIAATHSPALCAAADQSVQVALR
ncbi:MAG: ATP-binding cassette domain-containing protein [Hyphomonadaceae bacterium]|nr:ATP-binding cassette domain-containing protein [Hyphomonadaceae bacterium]